MVLCKRSWRETNFSSVWSFTKRKRRMDMYDEVSQSKILIIEDDENINNIIYDVLQKMHFLCTQAYSGSEGKMHVTHQEYQLIILDLKIGRAACRERSGSDGGQARIA